MKWSRELIETRLKQGQIDFHGADFSGLDIYGLKFAGTNLNHVNFENASLCLARLTHADIQHANFKDADLSGCNLQGASLQSADLSNTKLQQANFSNADLRHATLQYAEFYGTNLRAANLSNARLDYAILDNANFRYASLHNATMWKVKASKTDFRHADLRAAVLNGSNLHKSIFANANLENTKMPQCTLNHAVFMRANLRHANLREADFSHAVLINAWLQDADIQGTLFNEGTILPDARFISDENGNPMVDRYWRPYVDMARYINPQHVYFWLPSWAQDNQIRVSDRLRNAPSYQDLQAIIDELKRQDKLKDADLSGLQLQQIDLSLANLTNTDLRGTNLHGTVLTGADLTNAQLNDQSFNYRTILPDGRVWDKSVDLSVYTNPQEPLNKNIGQDWSKPNPFVDSEDIEQLLNSPDFKEWWDDNNSTRTPPFFPDMMDTTASQSIIIEPPPMPPLPPSLDPTSPFVRENVPADEPHFVVSYPPEVMMGYSFNLAVFAYLPQYVADVQDMINAGRDLPETRLYNLTDELNPETVAKTFTLIPVAHGIQFQPSLQIINWQDPYQVAMFSFYPGQYSEFTGKIYIYQGPVLIGEIPFSMRQPDPNAVSVFQDLQIIEEANYYRTVFASYSYRDLDLMEYFRVLNVRRGLELLHDVYEMRAAHYWSKELFTLIDKSSVFQLFWSANSAQSNYCREEWRYALHYHRNNPQFQFIRPTYWRLPMPDPPGEIASFPYRRILMPTLNRIQWWRANRRYPRKRSER